MIRKALLAFILLTAGIRAATPAEDAAATVVIYNANDSDAKGLADFYCTTRGIDPSRQIPLATPTTEEITRSDYDSSIAGALRDEFVKRGYWMVTRDMMNRSIVIASQIRYAVLIRGIPLKIKECGDYPGDSVIQPAPFGSVNAS
jgi:uncharacterized protein (TIGR03790 family)